MDGIMEMQLQLKKIYDCLNLQSVTFIQYFVLLLFAFKLSYLCISLGLNLTVKFYTLLKNVLKENHDKSCTNQLFLLSLI